MISEDSVWSFCATLSLQMPPFLPPSALARFLSFFLSSWIKPKFPLVPFTEDSPQSWTVL